MRKQRLAHVVALTSCMLLFSGSYFSGGPARAAKNQTQPSHRLHIINADLDFRPKTRPKQGRLLGYDPTVTNVRIGDKIQFVNTDDIVHTATGFAIGGQVVPEHYKFAGDATKASGRILSNSEWSTGNLRAHGGKSQVFVAKITGNFYYGCAYHLGESMRGVIVVSP